MNQEHVSALKFCIIPPNPFKYSTKKMLHSLDMYTETLIEHNCTNNTAVELRFIFWSVFAKRVIWWRTKKTSGRYTADLFLFMEPNFH